MNVITDSWRGRFTYWWWFSNTGTVTTTLYWTLKIFKWNLIFLNTFENKNFFWNFLSVNILYGLGIHGTSDLHSRYRTTSSHTRYNTVWYKQVCVRVCVWMCTCVCVSYLCVYIYVCVYMYVCMSVCVYVWVCMSISMCVCVSVYVCVCVRV